MIVDLVLIRVKAFINKKILDCNIAIDDGKIWKIGRETNMPKSDVRFDLQNLLVLPGLIDSHVHLRDEGKAYKEDFYSGTAAAAAGGVTAVLDMPNNNPVTMSLGTLRNRMSLAQSKVLVDVGFYTEFPKDKSELQPISEEGAVGLKLYMAEQVGGLDIQNDQAITDALNVVSTLKMVTAAHAEDQVTLKRNEDKIKNRGNNEINAFLKAHSDEVEVKAINRLLKLAKESGTHVHFCHVSTTAGLRAIADAKRAGLTVTCEVTPHHLLLSVKDLKRIGMLGVVMPPLRDKADVEGLWQAVHSGLVDVIGSDHAPHALREKEAESVWDVKVGFPGLETTVPLLLTEVHRGRISINDLVRMTCENPAAIFKLKNKGTLEQGKDADFVVIDFDRKYKIDSSKFHSKAKFSPFEGFEVTGKPVKTFVSGQLILDDDDIVAKPGAGRIIRRD